MEVDQRLQGNNGSNVLLVFCGCELFCGGVEAVDVGLMVFVVVQLHDLAGDGRLECTVVIYIMLVSKSEI